MFFLFNCCSTFSCLVPIFGCSTASVEGHAHTVPGWLSFWLHHWGVPIILSISVNILIKSNVICRVDMIFNYMYQKQLSQYLDVFQTTALAVLVPFSPATEAEALHSNHGSCLHCVLLVHKYSNCSLTACLGVNTPLAHLERIVGKSVQNYISGLQPGLKFWRIVTSTNTAKWNFLKHKAHY